MRRRLPFRFGFRIFRFVVALSLASAPLIAWQARPVAQPGYVGVSLDDLAPSETGYYGLKGPGVVAASVVVNGPAYKSGLREDDAIVSVDGKVVTNAAQAADLLRVHAAGEKVRIGLVHVENGRRIQIEIGVIAEPRPAGYGAGPPAAPIAPAPGGGRAAAPGGALRVVDPRSTVQGAPQQQGPCKAVVPQGWTFRAGQYGDTADLEGEGGRAHASWGIRGVNTAMRGLYGPMHGPPDEATLATASMAIQAAAQYTSGPMTVGFLTARSFSAGTQNGVVLMKAYQIPMPGQYVLSTYFAWADRSSPHLLDIAKAVLSTVSCTTHIRPSEPLVTAPRPGNPKLRRRGDESDDLQDYNAQLGTQWATSPSTGEHYLLDHATQWNDTGPDGPGYYRKAGNSYEKLNTGWQ